MHRSDSDNGHHVIVIGGGIVGVCCGLYLQRDGHRVTIIERNGPGEGASSGNAGQFVTGYCVPVALPGIVRQVPRMLLDPLGPLTIRWRYLPRLLPWLVRFTAAGSARRVEAIASALYDLNRHAMVDFEPLIQQADVERLIVRRGRLDVCASEEVYKRTRIKFDLLQSQGVEVEMIDREGIRELEPALGDDCRYGAFYPESSHTTDPLLLTRELARAFKQGGGTILRETVVGFDFETGCPTAVRTRQGRHAMDQMVVAAGAFSRPLAARLGSRVPLDAERGYHVMLPQAGFDLQRTVVYCDSYFGLTPMLGGMRLAGTVELASPDAPPNYARADNLLSAVGKVIPGLNATGATRWMGCRPSLPDSMPVLGRSPVHDSVYFAFGHGHLGLTGAATTGRIIADLVSGRPAHVDLVPFRADRF